MCERWCSTVPSTRQDVYKRQVVSVYDVGRRVTDQQHRNAGLVEDPGGRVVVGRQHGPFVAFGLHLLQVVGADLGPWARWVGVRGISPIDSCLLYTSDLVGYPFTALKLDGVSAAFLHESGGGRQRGGRAGLVAAERQVGDD